MSGSKAMSYSGIAIDNAGIGKIDLTKRYLPFPKQQIAHSAPEKYVLYGGSMRSGKSVWMVNEGIQLSLEYPGNVGALFRYELSTLKKTSLVTLDQYLDPNIVKYHHHTDQFVEFVNGSIMYYGGLKPTQADKPFERIKSFTLGWFGIEEATEVSEEYFLLLMSRLDHVLPNGTRPYYKGLLTANPEPGWVRNRFIINKNRNHRFIQALPTDNPYLPKDYIKELVHNYPKDWVKKYLEGNWDETETGHELVPLSWVIRAIKKKKAVRGRRVMSVDPARGGSNFSLIGRRCGYRVFPFKTLVRSKTMETVGEVARVADEFKPTIIVIDVVGVGGGVYDRLNEMGYPVQEFIGGASSIENDIFFNLRAEAYWRLRVFLENGKLNLPRNDNLSAQLPNILYKNRSDKTIQIESKIEMKRRGMKSPDEADALMMLFADSEGSFKIEYL